MTFKLLHAKRSVYASFSQQLKIKNKNKNKKNAVEDGVAENMSGQIRAAQVSCLPLEAF